MNDPDILELPKEHDITTPFGKPSSMPLEGRIAGVDCVLLARY